MFAWGDFSPQCVQKIAALACADMQAAREGRSFPDLEQLASLGTSGAHPNKCYADLMNKLHGNATTPEPCQGSAQFEQHPLRWQGDYRTHLIPLSMHGDDVPITGIGKGWVQKLTTFQWSSLVAYGQSTIDWLFWIWASFEKARQGGAAHGGTLHEFFAILRWSLDSLFSGVWPSEDWYSPSSREGRRAGTFLANGYRAVLWAIIGDLDYLAAVFGFPRHNAAKPCALCNCSTSGEHPWTDFSPSASWRATMWTPQSWLDSPSKLPNPLFSCAGVTACSVAYDYMHLKYLGSDQYSFGAVLTLLVYHVLPADPEENVVQIWDEIKTDYQQYNVPVRYRYLNKISMFYRPAYGFPKLRGKAAEIKYFGATLLRVWEKHMNVEIELHRRVRLMLRMNVMCEQLLTECKEEVCFPEPRCTQFAEAMDAMLLLQTQIAEHFVEEGLQYFDVTAKSHMLQHCALAAKHLSPRVVWCFAGEDMQKKLQTLAKSSVKGNG
ncbi:unnamed protein product, partial [Effrenium voratum]